MKRIWIGILVLALSATSPALAEKHPQGAPHPGGGAPRMGGGMPRASAPARVNTMRAHPMVRARAPAIRERARIGVRERSGFAAHRPMAVSRHRVGREVIVRHASPRFARFHRVTRAPRRFHIGVYHRPHGWFSHRWRLGERLPRAWFARSYWIPNWGIYGLWAPYDGLVWVRVGPDAFLIDPYTGEVVSIEYGVFFW
jgi:Ni/Co efflux regulator RcnB